MNELITPNAKRIVLTILGAQLATLALAWVVVPFLNDFVATILVGQLSPSYWSVRLKKIGDSVLLENGQTPGIVELVVATPEAMQELGVDVPGVMLLSPPFGRVYIPEQSLQSEPLELVSRTAPA